MNKKNKKGISAIIATVMIILITVAAVSIVWAAIIPMIRNQLETATVCVDAVSQIQIMNKGYTCVDRTSGNVSVQVSRGAKEFDLVNIDVLVSAKGNTQTFPAIGVMPDSNEERVYVIATGMNADDIESVQIAPIITTGNSEKTCDVSSTVVLRAC